MSIDTEDLLSGIALVILGLAVSVLSFLGAAAAYQEGVGLILVGLFAAIGCAALLMVYPVVKELICK